MCALFGWLDYKGIVPYKVLKRLTQALAKAAEERGTDAAGISYIKDIAQLAPAAMGIINQGNADSASPDPAVHPPVPVPGTSPPLPASVRPQPGARGSW